MDIHTRHISHSDIVEIRAETMNASIEEDHSLEEARVILFDALYELFSSQDDMIEWVKNEVCK